MNRQFKNGIFLIFNYKKDCFEIFKGNMLVENNKIKAFSKNDFKCDYDIVYLKGSLVTPIFINLHLHLGETNFRPLSQKMSLLEYLAYTEAKNKELGENSDKNWYDSAKKTLKECLESGTHIISTLRGQDVIKNYNIKAYSGFPVMKSAKLKKFYDGGINAFNDFYNTCISNNIVPGIFIHSFYANDYDSIKFARDCHKKPKTFVAVHVAEDAESEKLVREKWQMSSLEILKKFKMLNKKTFVIHGNSLSHDELSEIKKHRANLVICPISTLNLNNKILDVDYLVQNKIPFSLASDGLATGESANLLIQTKEMLRHTKNYQLIFKAITTSPQSALKLKNEILALKSMPNFNVFELNGENETDIEKILYNLLDNKFKLLNTYINGDILKI